MKEKKSTPNSRDMSTFSLEHLKEAAKILLYYRTTLDKTRLLSFPISIEINFESNTVFAVDENFRTAVIENDCLQDWLICAGGCLNEGFRNFMFSQGGCCRKVAELNREDLLVAS